MTFFQSILLSIVEGFTEFLPVSSTGHLILTSDILRLTQTEFIKSFEIIIQLGAILAVVFIYRKRLYNNPPLWKNIIISFLPTVILGFLFFDFVKGYLIGNSTIVAWSLLVGGVGMILFEKYVKTRKKDRLNLFDYVLIGIFQSVAMIPGVSRAMATIFGGMIVGMDRKRATEFSFFLAIPTMLGATALDLYKTNFSFSQSEIWLLASGLIGAFVTALIAVRFLIKYVQTHNYSAFGIYRIVLALLWFLSLSSLS